MLELQGSEDNDLVDAVHEFRREFPTRCIAGRSVNFLVQLRILVVNTGRKAQPARHQFRHLLRSQIRGHKDHGAGKSNVAIVSQRQSRLIEDSQKELPWSVARLFDLIKKDQGKLQLVSV